MSLQHPQRLLVRTQLLLKIASAAILLLLIYCLPSYSLNIVQNIYGIQGEPLKNVQAILKSQFKAANPNDSLELMGWYEHAEKNIKTALQPYGYFSPQITSNLNRVSTQTWHASFTITPGPRTRINAIDLAITGPGAALIALQRLQDNLPIKVGDVYKSKNYEKTKNLLFEIANKHGYLKARLTQNEVLVDVATHTATIILHFNTGPLYYFGNISFNQTPYYESFLRRFLTIQTGQPYSPQKLLQLQQNFANSHFFQGASITPLEKNADNYYIPINVNLTPYPSHQYLFGVGYGTDTHFRGSVGAHFRNLTKDGQQFSALLQAAQQVNNINFQAQYTIPGKNPLTQQYALIGGIESIRPQDLSARVLRFGVNYHESINNFNHTLAMILQRDHNDGGSTLNVKTVTYLLYPRYNFSYLDADDPIFTRNGAKINFSILGGLQQLGSSTSFAQVNTYAKLINTLRTDTRFILRGTAGYNAVKNDYNFPISMLFFTGGASSVRGFGYQDLGPGNKLLVGSTEIQQRIFGKFYVGGFYDIGNAFYGKSDFNNMNQSAGVSVMLATPIGPVALSFAKPIHTSSPTLGTKWRIQFSLGPDL